MKHTNIKEPYEFLKNHFKAVHAVLGPEFLIEIRAIYRPEDKKQSIFFPFGSISKSLSNVLKLNAEGIDIYFGVNPRPISRKKKAEDIEYLACLWTDIDVGPNRFYKTQEDALGIIRHFRTRPHLVIDSGNGFHCYWYLAKPISLKKEEQRVNVEKILAGLINSMKADPSGSSLERIMRLPGTINHKNGRKCQIMEEYNEK